VAYVRNGEEGVGGRRRCRSCIRRGVGRGIEHLGSAHDDAELEVSMARQRMVEGRGVLDWGWLRVSRLAGPLEITSLRIGAPVGRAVSGVRGTWVRRRDGTAPPRPEPNR
jgi:hypothetical protein